MIEVSISRPGRTEVYWCSDFITNAGGVICASVEYDGG